MTLSSTAERVPSRESAGWKSPPVRREVSLRTKKRLVVGDRRHMAFELAFLEGHEGPRRRRIEGRTLQQKVQDYIAINQNPTVHHSGVFLEQVLQVYSSRGSPISSAYRGSRQLGDHATHLPDRSGWSTSASRRKYTCRATREEAMPRRSAWWLAPPSGGSIELKGQHGVHNRTSTYKYNTIVRPMIQASPRPGWRSAKLVRAMWPPRLAWLPMTANVLFGRMACSARRSSCRAQPDRLSGTGPMTDAGILREKPRRV